MTNDIPLLVEHFIKTSARKLGRPTPPLTLGAVQRRQQYDWHGNIRELEADNIRAARKKANGKVSGPGGAAELLGIKPTTLASRMKALGITIARYVGEAGR